MDLYNYKYMDQLFLESYKAMEQLKLLTDRQLFVEEVEHGVVLPCRICNGIKKAGVLDSEGNYVQLSAFEALSAVDSWGGKYEIEGEIADNPETVVYFGRFWKHWGHFLMDMVSRLWWVIENDSKIKIAYDGKENINGVYLEFFRLLGISEEQLVRVDRPTRFKKVIIPECSHKPGISCSEKYKMIFDLAAENALRECDNIDKYADQAVYLTRRQLKLKVPFEIGEKDIEALFEKQGYLVVAPERLPLVEQICIVRTAKTIACLSGTLPHNMMFAKDGSRLFVVRKTNKPNYRQVSVNQIRQLKVVNIDAHISLKAVGPAGPFIVVINQNVERFFSDVYGSFKYPRFLYWFKRKIYLLWYIPLYFLRNRNAVREVPIFNGRYFSTTPTAKKDLLKFYLRRI